jgi:hypothetical protein
VCEELDRLTSSYALDDAAMVRISANIKRALFYRALRAWAGTAALVGLAAIAVFVFRR